MKNLPAMLYALAAAIWLVLGILNWSAVYLALAVVFFVLAFKKRKPKGEETEK